MDSQPRVTQRDVAKAAGVDRATVSLALRGLPSIPAETRQRIEIVARRLGYAPDPMLAALANYRNRIRQQKYHGTLVWLAHTQPHYRWRDILHFVEYLQGAEAQAAAHGYRIEVFDIGEMNTSWERASSIAHARGIKGILVCPQPDPDTRLEKFPWDRFSAVSFGYSLTRPLLNCVTAGHFRAAMTVMRELHARGYRRIGCALRPGHDRRVDHNLQAGYLTGCSVLGLEPLPLCPDDGYDSEGSTLQAWLNEQKPDALILGNHRPLEAFGRWGIKVPDDLAVACPSMPAPRDGLSGMIEQNRLIGAAAVDLLVAMIQRGERGVPATPQRLLIDSTWHAGSTLRPVANIGADQPAATAV
jgi:DNA-binding LacI/PurR family transcriptional regulator